MNRLFRRHFDLIDLIALMSAMWQAAHATDYYITKYVAKAFHQHQNRTIIVIALIALMSGYAGKSTRDTASSSSVAKPTGGGLRGNPKSTECVIGQAIADRRRHIVMQKKLKKIHDLKEKCEAKATAYEASELPLHILANTAEYIEARNA